MGNSMMSLGLMEAVTNVAEKTISAISGMQSSGETVSFGEVLNTRISGGEKNAQEEELPLAAIPPESKEDALSDVQALVGQLTESEEAPAFISDATAQQAVFLLKVVKSMLESVMKDAVSADDDGGQCSTQDLLTSLFAASDDDEDDNSVYDLFGILYAPTDYAGITDLTTTEIPTYPKNAASAEVSLFTDSGNTVIGLDSLFTRLTSAQSALTQRIDTLIEQLGAQVQTETPQQTAFISTLDGIPRQTQLTAEQPQPASKDAAVNASGYTDTSADLQSEAAEIVKLASVKKQSVVKTDGIEELFTAAPERTAEPQMTFTSEIRQSAVPSPQLQTIEKIRELIDSLVTENVPQKELTMTLNPESLGRIAIRVSQSEQGITVVMSAQNTATERLLQDNIANFSAAVRSQGSEIADIRVVDPAQAGFAAELNLGGYGNPQQQSGGGSTSGSHTTSEDETEAVQSAADYRKEAILWERA